LKDKAVVASIILLFLTVVNGVTYASWEDGFSIQGRVKMGAWKGRVRIRETLEGAFTDPETGDTLAKPTDLVAVAADYPTRFRLTICVANRGSTRLTDIVVTDVVKNTVAPVEWHPEEGVTWTHHAPSGDEWDGSHYGFNELTWEAGALRPGEEAYLVVWVETLQNPTGRHEPTCGDEGDGQDLEVNGGATVTATSPFKRLTATTEGITILIEDDGVEGNGIGRIMTPLPHETPWAEDRYP